MNVAEMKRTIETAFSKLERMADSSQEAMEYLDKAYEIALRDERRHRLGVGSRYKLTPYLAARYFVARWYAEPVKVTSALKAAQLRGDALYGAALRELLKELPPEVSAVTAIDYSEHIATKEPA